MEQWNQKYVLFSPVPKLTERMLYLPEFRDERGTFSVCLKKSNTANYAGSTISELILEFCKTPRSRKEIAEFLRFKSETYVINKYVTPLVDKQLITLAVPDKPSSSKQKYTTKQ